MKSFLFRFVFFAFVATSLTLSAVAQTQLGQIKAARIEGEVFKISAAGTQVPLNNGDLLVESDSVLTGEKGSVVLVFQNGSTVHIAPGSRLKIEEFKMDPLAEGTDFAALTAEPSPSQTRLNLAFGEIVGNVKKLTGTSNYDIKTPAGAAGIRGTTFRIVFRPSDDGSAFRFQITTTEGVVLFEGTATGVAGVSVPAGTEIAVEVSIDPASGAVTMPAAVVTTAPISDSTKAVIEAIATQAAQMTTSATFSPTPPPPSTPPPTESKEVTVPAPEPTKTTITLTQGAGR